MSYMLKTTENESGRRTFVKQRKGKSFVYLVETDDHQKYIVDKNWILNHHQEIQNVGISGSMMVENIRRKDNGIRRPVYIVDNSDHFLESLPVVPKEELKRCKKIADSMWVENIRRKDNGNKEDC